MSSRCGTFFSSSRGALILSAVMGGVLGMVVAWCTNAAMVEISINEIFALYFGFFFLLLSGIIGWRVYNFSQAANRKALLVLSAVMGLAGLICVFYQRKWFFTMSAAGRVPIYTILGVSLSFALTFAIAELLNYASSHTGGFSSSSGPAPRANSALVQTPQQIFLLAAASMTAGFFYGVIFGFSELGRGVFALHTLRSQFLHEEKICLPIGIVIGAVTGVFNEKWRTPAPNAPERNGKQSAFEGFGAESVTSSSSASAPYRRVNAGHANDVDESDIPNAFATSTLDDFDPFPTTNKQKY